MHTLSRCLKNVDIESKEYKNNDFRELSTNHQDPADQGQILSSHYDASEAPAVAEDNHGSEDKKSERHEELKISDSSENSRSKNAIISE